MKIRLDIGNAGIGQSIICTLLIVAGLIIKQEIFSIFGFVWLTLASTVIEVKK